MKAARIHRFGGPEVIAIDEVDVPRPGPRALRIKVEASSVNPVDYKIRKGGFLPAGALPIALGRDVAGVVDAVGAEAAGFEPGDAVFAMLEITEGGNADYAVAEAAACAPAPAGLDMVRAGSLGLAALTAWQGLFDHGALGAGQRVLIHGAAGGVGHLAVQFALARGAGVAATCAGADVDFVRGLGAETVIDYQTQRFEDQVGPCDMVYDLIGGETQERSWAVLRDGGILVSTLTAPDTSKSGGKGRRGAHYMARPNGAQLRLVAGLVAEGTVTPHVARTMDLFEVAEAHRTLEHDHVRGKLVLTVG